MNDLDRYLLLCDPLPENTARTREWRKAVHSVARIILDVQNITPWKMAEILARIPIERSLDADWFGPKAASAVARALQDSSGSKGLLGCVCAMCAGMHIVESARLSAKGKVVRRNSIAVGLWSALSFQSPLPEERLEDVRARILDSARRAGLEFARGTRARRSVPANAGANQYYFDGLQENAVLDQEEIKMLRWTLADESLLLNRAYAEVDCDESVALARGLELGQLLIRFPDYDHFELASRDISTRVKIDLEGLLDAVGGDREAMTAPFEGNSIVEGCPNVFPLLTALREGSTRHADSTVARPLADWCGRALLESAIVRRSESSRGRR